MSHCEKRTNLAIKLFFLCYSCWCSRGRYMRNLQAVSFHLTVKGSILPSYGSGGSPGAGAVGVGKAMGLCHPSGYFKVPPSCHQIGAGGTISPGWGLMASWCISIPSGCWEPDFPHPDNSGSYSKYLPCHWHLQLSFFFPPIFFF